MITKKDIEKIASLARIHLAEGETDTLAKNLESILGYVQKLKTLDVRHVEPTSHAMPIQNVYRDDIVKTSLDQKDALKIAPQKHNGFFKVPQIIE